MNYALSSKLCVIVSLSALLACCGSGNSDAEPSGAQEGSAFRLVPVFGDAAFDGPTDIEPIPGSPGEYLLVEKEGLIRLANSETGSVTTLADMGELVSASGMEEGLLSLALTPDFERTGELFVYYSADRPRRAVLSRLTFDGGAIDLDSEQVILDKPHERNRHWGGGMAFAEDGNLLLSIGDGSPHGDEFGNAQDLTDLEGSVLRLTITPSGYSIPADNPFTGNEQGFREEVWAYGLRNPWRIALDAHTGELWVADTGHADWEEINVVEAGANLGWSIREGFECFRAETCQEEGLVEPIAVYSHDEGCAIIGGHVYRGVSLPELQGRYIFGDYCAGTIWAVSKDEGRRIEILDSDEQIYAFAEDQNGELLVLTAAGGIFRLTRAE